ncbi:MAG: ABC transporter ATP-binding protein, partial [Merdibacter sp.]
MKPFAVSILAIIVLLFAQAMCELTMPDYMSNIVNVGINSNGIEDGVLQAVRAQEYEKLALFMSEEEQQIFADNYTLVTPSQASEAQLERYPALADEDVYLLREDAVNTHEGIRQALSQAETYVAGIDQMEVTLQEAMNDPNKAAELSEEQQQLLAVMQQLPQGTSVYDVLGMLSSQQMADLSAQMDEVAQALGESSIDTANAQYVYGEYTAIGMDTEAIQYQYLFVNGAW